MLECLTSLRADFLLGSAESSGEGRCAAEGFFFLESNAREDILEELPNKGDEGTKVDRELDEESEEVTPEVGRTKGKDDAGWAIACTANSSWESFEKYEWSTSETEEDADDSENKSEESVDESDSGLLIDWRAENPRGRFVRNFVENEAFSPNGEYVIGVKDNCGASFEEME